MKGRPSIGEGSGPTHPTFGWAVHGRFARWRATNKMVCTYIHTGGTNGLGTDRQKRRYTQISDGTVRENTYHVKRPRVSSEYQSKMGAIDGHNFRRQSGKGVRPLEKVWVSNDSKDRIFINVVSWVIVNMYLANQYFIHGGK